jgi:RNA polymerase-binding transcription factor DksA
MSEYRELRQHLTARLTQLERRLHTLEADHQHATDLLDPDWAEQATALQNDAVRTKLAEEVHRQVVAIRAALTHMAQGTYGICRTCEEPIALKRLTALPYASQCLACATQAEQGHDPGTARF